MALPREQDRLQPSLLDRLLDDAPGERSEAPEQRFLSKARLRQAVVRDLGWLLNATRPPVGDDSTLVRGSVTGYGMPALSGSLVAQLDLDGLERELHRVICSFEPRIVADTLEVRAIRSEALLDSHNMIDFEIRGMLWSQPVPLELVLRTTFDFEANLVQVRDAHSGRTAGVRED